MSVSTVTNTPQPQDSTSSATSSGATSANQTVSTTDFMELLSTEMANQDPMQPMDPTQTMTQLAQFTTLQQTNALQQNQSISTANSFLGTTVTIPGQNGQSPTIGTVSAIDSSSVASGGVPKLVINGASAEYPVTSVAQVQLTAPASSSSTSGSSSSTGSTSTGSTTDTSGSTSSNSTGSTTTTGTTTS